jgi:hypothetical protein
MIIEGLGEAIMSIFGAKPNAAFVVILYDQNPPTGDEQDRMLAEIYENVRSRQS